MGQMLIEHVLAAPDTELVGAFDLPGQSGVGKSAGMGSGIDTDVVIVDDVERALRDATMLIDFTVPSATLTHLDIARSTGLKLVIGTTGFDAEGRQRIVDASASTALVFSPNMGVGVNVTLKLLEVAARFLNDGFDVEIIEAHHRHKVDAPSGTALEMGRVVAATLGVELNGPQGVGVLGRHGITGERPVGQIGFSAIRGGDIVGDHTVLFAGNGERIEITHRASSRSTYADGALRACRFLRHRQHGLFSMQDVLGLTHS
jgi:4-hydroxy-tetrahydrodipicolinate reductase